MMFNDLVFACSVSVLQCSNVWRGFCSRKQLAVLPSTNHSNDLDVHCYMLSLCYELFLFKRGIAMNQLSRGGFCLAEILSSTMEHSLQRAASQCFEFCWMSWLSTWTDTERKLFPKGQAFWARPKLDSVVLTGLCLLVSSGASNFS
jgi:hypothetical protein